MVLVAFFVLRGFAALSITVREAYSEFQFFKPFIPALSALSNGDLADLAGLCGTRLAPPRGWQLRRVCVVSSGEFRTLVGAERRSTSSR